MNQTETLKEKRWEFLPTIVNLNTLDGRGLPA